MDDDQRFSYNAGPVAADQIDRERDERGPFTHRHSPPSALHPITPEFASAVESVSGILGDDRSELNDYLDNSELIRSFDMIFHLHQRSEEMRAHLDSIDRVVLTARTVEGFTRQIMECLERDLDLVSARILYREDHPVAALLLWDPPAGAGIVSSGFLENEGLSGADPFVLDDPSGIFLGLFSVISPS